MNPFDKARSEHIWERPTGVRHHCPPPVKYAAPPNTKPVASVQVAVCNTPAAQLTYYISHHLASHIFIAIVWGVVTWRVWYVYNKRRKK
jgi:hypothetical protein